MSTNLTYDDIWQVTPVIDPQIWPQYWWLKAFNLGATALEIGPGTRPKLPLADTTFVDTSRIAVEKLKEQQANAMLSDVAAMPFPASSFGLVCAFNLLGTVADDTLALREIMRVVKQDGFVVLSLPLHMHKWTYSDQLLGTVRRYNPAVIYELLQQIGFQIFTYKSVFGLLTRLENYLATALTYLYQDDPLKVYTLIQDIIVPGYRFKLALSPRDRVTWQRGDFIKDTRNAAEVIVVCKPRFSHV